jgi:hypothetical protein
MCPFNSTQTTEYEIDTFEGLGYYAILYIAAERKGAAVPLKNRNYHKY